MRPQYNFTIGVAKDYVNILNRGNERQVFEYIFSDTVEKRLQTYVNVFIRLKQCSLPQPRNLFFIYYVIQSFECNLKSVWENMSSFLIKEGIAKSRYDKYNKIYEETLEFLHRFYQQKIDTATQENITYDIESQKSISRCPYTQETFELPSEILRLCKELKPCDDLSDYKEIIEMILLNNGKYKLTDKDKEYYSKNFNILLSTSSVAMKNNCAESSTLQYLANIIYKKDLEILEQKHVDKDEDCEDMLKYIKIYKAILKQVTNN
jgi:hypothetical protein